MKDIVLAQYGHSISVTQAEIEAHRRQPSLVDFKTMETRRNLESLIDDQIRAMEFEDKQRGLVQAQLEKLDEDYAEMIAHANRRMADNTFTREDAESCVRRIEKYLAERKRIEAHLAKPPGFP